MNTHDKTPGVHCTMPQPQPVIPSAPVLHYKLEKAKNKTQVIEALAEFVSASGGFSGASKEARSKCYKDEATA